MMGFYHAMITTMMMIKVMKRALKFFFFYGLTDIRTSKSRVQETTWFLERPWGIIIASLGRAWDVGMAGLSRPQADDRGGDGEETKAGTQVVQQACTRDWRACPLVHHLGTCSHGLFSLSFFLVGWRSGWLHIPGVTVRSFDGAGASWRTCQSPGTKKRNVCMCVCMFVRWYIHP